MTLLFLQAPALNYRMYEPPKIKETRIKGLNLKKIQYIIVVDRDRSDRSPFALSRILINL